jgi:hypothetical protein
MMRSGLACLAWRSSALKSGAQRAVRIHAAPVPVTTTTTTSWQVRHCSNGYNSGGDEVHQSIEVPNHCIGGIIGRGGSKINIIRDASEAFINIENEGDPRLINVSGTAEGVAMAIEMLNARVEELTEDPDA